MTRGPAVLEKERSRSRSHRRAVASGVSSNEVTTAVEVNKDVEQASSSSSGGALPQSLSTRCLTYTLEAQDGRARAATIQLPHGPVQTPVFMPVGTQGTIKGLLSREVKALGPQIILGNTYHLANRPNCDRLRKCGGLHNFMQWDRNILTDSGGFQMVSLLKLASINEQGVEFEDPKNPGSMMLLTPEESIRSQNAIGSDIMMQLDDVVSSCEPDKKRVEEATHRTTRWLDRCIAAHANPERQNLFAIVQGGLHEDLRKISLADLKARGDHCPGYAIGGLSGGESKHEFWQVVAQCTDEEKDGLPKLKPRYCMGVGYMLDIVVCVALGVDMFDCVYPCRTARFGTALTRQGQLRLSSAARFENDFGVIEEGCDCYTCAQAKYSRSYLSQIVAKNDKSNPVGATLLTIHNVRFMMRLMSDMRKAILEGKFSEWVVRFLQTLYPQHTPSDSSTSKTSKKIKMKQAPAAQKGEVVDHEKSNGQNEAPEESKVVDEKKAASSMKPDDEEKADGPLLPPLWVKDALMRAKIRGLKEAFDWENGTHSKEDMPKMQ
ncbi:unnamed protein product [Amoebophrya sp. A25]|nr:unnamed protein product [Amoebophrya sp. A25]|eukprot:GSA25T00020079001.1